LVRAPELSSKRRRVKSDCGENSVKFTVGR
jgi:hypothetical protein